MYIYIVPPSTKGYHINASISKDSSKALIEYDTDAYKTKDASNGYYINNGFESSTNEIIKCTLKDGCSTVKVSGTACSDDNIGKVIKFGSSLKLCISDESGEALEITKDNEQKLTKGFRLSNIGDFPGSIRKPISVDINGDGSALLNSDTDGQLPICSSTCQTDKYCVSVDVDDEYKKQMVQTIGDNACENISIGSEGQIFYFNEENKKVSSPDDTVKKAYQCSSSECTVIDEKTVVIQSVGILTCDAINGCQLKKPTSDIKTIYDRMKTNNCLTDNTLCTKEGVDETRGYLYTCIYDSDSPSVTCSLINNVGYYIDKVENTDVLYTCTNNEGVKCIKSLKTEDDTSTCSGSNNGKVIYIESKFGICNENGIQKDLTSETIEYIIYGNDGADSTYGLTTGQYGIINANESYVIFEKDIKGKQWQ